MHDLVAEGSQFIVSTHSPILLGYPGARIYVLSSEGIVEAPYEETDVVTLTRSFLEDRDRFLRHLFDDRDRGRHPSGGPMDRAVRIVHGADTSLSGARPTLAWLP